ncbi:hypothetical protein Bphy_2398 [Paraburkholderia phymatum STM815]|uniref:Uncharacterized protein n=1 Tax=Paraburkholderia phymatum (strain DSM 17167 / CIP 108236 / LMG 21445 / STM815) TaxID=391038 RepID=B2JFU8_PARP8|nr:hypothetical protein Bphy_2398 [Paraburkholderia phymatum STM815]
MRESRVAGAPACVSHDGPRPTSQAADVATALLCDSTSPKGAFAVENRMAGYGAAPPHGRPADGACERRFMAGSRLCRRQLAYRTTAIERERTRLPSAKLNDDLDRPYMAELSFTAELSRSPSRQSHHSACRSRQFVSWLHAAIIELVIKLLISRVPHSHQFDFLTERGAPCCASAHRAARCHDRHAPANPRAASRT